MRVEVKQEATLRRLAKRYETTPAAIVEFLINYVDSCEEDDELRELLDDEFPTNHDDEDG